MLRARASAAVLSAVALAAAGIPAALDSAQAASVGAPATAPAVPPVASPDTVLTFFAGLPRDGKALRAAARAASTPESGSYRAHLPLAKAGRVHGATREAIDALRAAAGDLGITVRVDPTRIFARLSAPVSTWESVMGVSVTYEPATTGSSALGNAPFAKYRFTDPVSGLLLAAPGSLAGVVSEFLPAMQIYRPSRDIPGRPAPLRSASPRSIWGGDDLPWPTNTGTPLGPTCDDPEIAARGVFTPSQLNVPYGTAALHRRGYSGADARMTVVALGGGFTEDDVTAYAECFDIPVPEVTVELGTGNRTPYVSWSIETALDIQTSMGVLDGASEIRVVEATYDSYSVGFLDGIARALNQDGGVPDAVSVSYAQCEFDVYGTVHVGQRSGTLQPIPRMLDDVLAMAGIVGTSVVVATGDNSSVICQAQGAPSVTTPTVAFPANSRFVTAAGGTRITLGAGNRRESEVAWNDSRYGLRQATGGGVSLTTRAPWYQRNGAHPTGRTLPDISTVASAGPGFPIFWGGTIQPVGGTSVAAPFQAANLALISARERAKGRSSIGFANPWLYSLSVPRTYDDYFHDVVEGDTQVLIDLPDGEFNVPACCAAAPGPDLATGIGSPDFAALARALPRR